MHAISFPEANGKSASGVPILRLANVNVTCVQFSEQDMARLAETKGIMFDVVNHHGSPEALEILKKVGRAFYITDKCPTRMSLHVIDQYRQCSACGINITGKVPESETLCAECVGKGHVIEKPVALATLLAQSLATVETMRLEAVRLLESGMESSALEVLQEMQRHLDGTSIASAEDCGAWWTKDGWQTASTHPFANKEPKA